MNKFLLIGVSVLGLFLSSEAYCACMPPITRCECAFPEFKNGVLSCGPTYCPSGTTCMPMGSCCKNDKVCGSELFPSCCSDTESCMSDGSCCTTPNQAKTQCCDTNGNGVANDDTCCPALETEGCETEVDTTTGCNKCKTSCTSDSDCSSGQRCCKELNKCIGKNECCGTEDACARCAGPDFCDPELAKEEGVKFGVRYASWEPSDNPDCGEFLYCEFVTLTLDGEETDDATALCSDPSVCRK